jgi:hypothetical protein
MTRITIQIRVTEEQKTAMRDRADAAGLSVTDFILSRCLDHAQAVTVPAYVPSVVAPQQPASFRILCPSCARKVRVGTCKLEELPRNCPQCAEMNAGTAK